MIKLRFVEGGGWDSKVIQWRTQCEWSHVECMWSDTETFGAMLRGGVKLRKLTDPNYRNMKSFQIWGIQCTAEQEDNFRDWLWSQNGKPYDWRAIVNVALGLRGQRAWRAEDYWFCSDQQFRGLEVSELIALPANIPVSVITPRDVWILIEVGMKIQRLAVRLR